MSEPGKYVDDSSGGGNVGISRDAVSKHVNYPWAVDGGPVGGSESYLLSLSKGAWLKRGGGRREPCYRQETPESMLRATL